VAALTPAVLIVVAIVLGALVLFATEPVPVDITAIGVMVALLLVEPVSSVLAGLGVIASDITLIDAQQGLSGFASPATLTVLAMFILSDGVQRTGVIHALGAQIASYTGSSESRQLGATIGLVGPLSGIINNTAAVAILLPMVSNLAHEGGTSPSKLLMPLSYASMLGGTLTLIGTSTNILASEIAARPEFLGRPLSMFEFTHLGVLVSLVGIVYLFTVGRWLLPARIDPTKDITEEFQLGDYLTEVVVREDSPLAGKSVAAGLRDAPFDVDVLQLVRDDEVFLEPLARKAIRPGDILVIRTDRDTLVDMLDAEGIDLLPDVTVDAEELEAAESEQNLVELVVAPGSSLVGDSLAGTRFRERYDATVLALRRGRQLIRQRLDHVALRVGDTLLVQATTNSIARFENNRDFILAGEIDRHDFRPRKMPIAVGIVLSVVILAALNVLPIVVAALAGALAMVLTGCLDPSEVYDAVHWDVIFLLAGVIPLGIAMETSGTADLLAAAIVDLGSVLPAIGVLALFYLVTALLTNVVSNNASVVLLLPVAFEAARAIDANPFAFLLAVMFAASTAFMTPVGYQTNLFVYGPGGYRFTDYLRVGAPLQLVLTAVTTLGIWWFWGV
jgi:di/tricarboxylate transporter